jgi:general secretion pathway protein N
VIRRLALTLPPIALAGLLAWQIVTPDPLAEASSGPPGATLAAKAHDQKADARSQAAEATVSLAQAAQRILERPLFNPDRRPPPPPAAAPAAAPPKSEFLRLSGTVIGPSGRSAIFVDSEGHARVVGEGGVIGEFSIRAITPGQVTLTSSAGERVLHPTFPKTDTPASSGSNGTSE